MRVNNLYVWSNAEIGSNLEVKGAMAVTGSVTHSGNLTIGGNLAVTGTSEFSDAVNFNGSNVQFGTGVYLKATGGKLYAGSTGGGSDLDFVAGTLTLKKEYPENNDLRGGIAISRGVSGGKGANGIGASIAFNLENNFGVLTPAGAIEVSLEDATNGSEDTKINISGKVGGTTTDLLTFTGGKWIFRNPVEYYDIIGFRVVDKQIELNAGGLEEDAANCRITASYGTTPGVVKGYFGFYNTDTSQEQFQIYAPAINGVPGKSGRLEILSNIGGLCVTGAGIKPVIDGTSTKVQIRGQVSGSEDTLLEIERLNDVLLCRSEAQNLIKTVKVKSVRYDNSPQSFAVPEGFIVTNIMVNVAEAFNDTGTDLLDVGITGDLERYVADLDVSTTGWKTLTLTNVPDIIGAGGTNIVLTYTGQNADATAGNAYVYVEYIYYGA